jgi:DNA-binding MarR family transcriptional regulator
MGLSMEQPMTELPETESLHSLFVQICKLKHARVHTLLENLGLYRGQPALLQALWEQEGLMHTELARRLQVQPATITKMLQRMEKAGFVERRPDAGDLRVSRVYLTEAGRAVRGDVQAVWRQLDEEAFAGFTAGDRALLRRFFFQIRENLEDVTGDA